MAGRPRRKARLESERAAGAKKRASRVDAGTRARVLARGEVVGLAEAAREAGIDPSLARKWKSRAAKGESVSASAGSVPVAPVVGGGEAASAAERLRGEAELSRRSARLALDQADALLRGGQASESRNAAVLANSHDARARELEELARVQEVHEQRLSADRATAVAQLVAAAFRVIGVPVPEAALRELAARAAAGEPLRVTEATASEAREAAQRSIRAQVRGELEAELAEREAERAAADAEAPAGEGEGVLELHPGGWRDERDAAAGTAGDGEVELTPRDVRPELRRRFPVMNDAIVAEREARREEAAGAGTRWGRRRAPRFAGLRMTGGPSGPAGGGLLG